MIERLNEFNNLSSLYVCFYLNYLFSIVLMGHDSMQVIVGWKIWKKAKWA